MNKLTGNGKPSAYTHGEVGQFYEDITTGDIYECRRSSKYSPTHGAPVGGYWWELRVSGKDRTDHEEFYGASGGDSDGDGKLDPHQQMVTDKTGAPIWEDRTHYDSETVTYEEKVYNPNVMESDRVVLEGIGYYENRKVKTHDGAYLLLSIGDKQCKFESFSIANTALSAINGRLVITYNSNRTALVVTLIADIPNPGTHISAAYCYPTLKQLDEKFIPDTIARTADVPSIQTATVGQTIAVKAVDENGKPTEWEAVDAGGGSSGTSPLFFEMVDGADISPSVSDFDLEDAMLKGIGIVLYDDETGEVMNCISYSVPGNGYEYCVFYSALLKDYYHIAIASPSGEVTVNSGLPNTAPA